MKRSESTTGGNGARRNRKIGARSSRPAIERLEDRRLLSGVIYSKIESDLKTALDNAQNRLTMKLNAYAAGATSTIPIIGNQIANAAQFVAQVESALTALTTLTTKNPSLDVPTAFSQAFSSYLVNVNDGPGGLGDVNYHVDDTNGSFHLSISPHLAACAHVNFDLGLQNGLPLTLASNTSITITGAVDFEFKAAIYTATTIPQAALDSSTLLAGGLPGVGGHELGADRVRGIEQPHHHGDPGILVQGKLYFDSRHAEFGSCERSVDNLNIALTLISLNVHRCREPATHRRIRARAV